MLVGRNRPCKQKLGGDSTSVIGMKSTFRASMHFVIAARAQSTARTTGQPFAERMGGYSLR